MTISEFLYKLNRNCLEFSSDAFLMGALKDDELPDEFIVKKSEELGPDGWLVINPQFKDHPLAAFRNRSLER